MEPYDATTNRTVARSGSTSRPTAQEVRRLARPADESWIQDFGSVQVGFVGAVTEDLPSLVSPTASPTSRSPTSSTRPTPRRTTQGRRRGRHRAAGPRGCGRTALCRRRPTRTRPSARSSTVSTLTSTRSCRVTRTCPTTTRSRSRPGRPRVVRSRRVRSSRPVSTARSSTRSCSPSTRSPATCPRSAGDPGAGVRSGASCGGYRRPLDGPLPGRPGDQADRGRRRGPGRRARRPVLGQIDGPFNRAKINGTVNGQPALVENRGGESTVGNLVAEVQRWATEAPAGRCADRVHEPRWSPRGHGRRRQRCLPARPDLPSGRRAAAVRQHPGQHAT